MDKAGKWAVENNVSVQEKIKQEFGPSIFNSKNEMDRSELGKAVFAQSNSLKKLNEIVHPVMLSRVFSLIEQGEKSAAPYLLIDAALIFELGFDKDCDLVVTVTAPVVELVKRVQKRNGLSREEIEQRLSAQLPQEQKASKSDYVIKNDGLLSQLESDCKKLHEWLLLKSKK